MLLLFRDCDKKQAFLQTNNLQFLHLIDADVVENFQMSSD